MGTKNWIPKVILHANGLTVAATLVNIINRSSTNESYTYPEGM